VSLVARQTNTPRDPKMIDAQGYQDMLQEYRGKPLVVNFWATWCEPCRDEYPLLNEMAKQYAPQGLKVVGVNFDDDGDLILMRRFLARYKPVFPNYRKKHGGNAEFAQVTLPQWNGSLPATLFYDKDGRQVNHFLGAGNRERFETAIRSLLSEGATNSVPLQNRPTTRHSFRGAICSTRKAISSPILVTVHFRSPRVPVRSH
jgi:thiol-disulfide isomerase/thioredoxin